jgi:hypothetical protein
MGRRVFFGAFKHGFELPRGIHFQVHLNRTSLLFPQFTGTLCARATTGTLGLHSGGRFLVGAGVIIQ